jgi:hypothetical protein
VRGEKEGERGGFIQKGLYSKTGEKLILYRKRQDSWYQIDALKGMKLESEMGVDWVGIFGNVFFFFWQKGKKSPDWKGNKSTGKQN